MVFKKNGQEKSGENGKDFTTFARKLKLKHTFPLNSKHLSASPETALGYGLLLLGSTPKQNVKTVSRQFMFPKLRLTENRSLQITDTGRAKNLQIKS